MSIFADVQRVISATRADIVRVATRGGDTRADWDIAHAIEQVTGRPATDIMWASHTRRAEAEQVASTNPRAVHDPSVTIYGENTSPDETRQIAPHHPGDHEDQADDIEDEPEQDEQVTASDLADTVFSDLAEVLDDAAAALRLTRAWSTPTEGRLLLHQVLRSTPRTRYATPSIAPAA